MPPSTSQGAAYPPRSRHDAKPTSTPETSRSLACRQTAARPRRHRTSACPRFLPDTSIRIGGNSRLRDVAAIQCHHARLGAVGRVAELLFQQRRRRLSVQKRSSRPARPRPSAKPIPIAFSSSATPSDFEMEWANEQTMLPTETIYRLKTLCNSGSRCQRELTRHRQPVRHNLSGRGASAGPAFRIARKLFGAALLARMIPGYETERECGLVAV